MFPSIRLTNWPGATGPEQTECVMITMKKRTCLPIIVFVGRVGE
jgi:hypothetical protein